MQQEPKIALLCELFVDYDEGLQEWRYWHVKMVERTIGTKKGTGGSDGAKYLRKTLNEPIFTDLGGNSKPVLNGYTRNKVLLSILSYRSLFWTASL